MTLMILIKLCKSGVLNPIPMPIRKKSTLQHLASTMLTDDTTLPTLCDTVLTLHAA